MNHVTTRLLSAVVAAIALSACSSTSSRPDSYGERSLSAENPEALIGEIATLAGTEITRLHPSYVWEALSDREGDGELNGVFETVLKEDTEESRLALVRVLELKFIHDPETSVLDLLGPELSAHFRNFAWQYGDYPGGPDGPNEAFADVMVDALDIVRPERRANRTRMAVVLRPEATEEAWAYMESEWVPIPGQEDRMLNRHARESFIEMREQARKEGVELVVLSAHRSRKRAQANAARANNPAAVASFSAHSLGLAADFQMSHGGLEFSEITTRPMAEVVRMRESPVHKWLFLRGDDFGWYPYQNEPWHWEYNPPGFRPLFWSGFPGGAPKRN